MNAGGPFARYSLAGWVFLIVLGASVALSANQTYWNHLTTLLTSPAGGNQPVGGIVAAAIGVIGGVSAPPALGFVLSRAAAAIMERSKHLRPDLDHGDRDARFYSGAAQALIDWRRERGNQVYASLSCALAGPVALGIAWLVFSHAWVWGVVVVTMLLAVLLTGDALRADRERMDAKKAWLDHPERYQQPPAVASCPGVAGLLATQAPLLSLVLLGVLGTRLISLIRAAKGSTG